jgi:hypothetical protein
MHGVQCTCAVCRWYMKPSKSWGLRLARVQVDSGPSGSSAPGFGQYRHWRLKIDTQGSVSTTNER